MYALILIHDIFNAQRFNMLYVKKWKCQSGLIGWDYTVKIMFLSM